MRMMMINFWLAARFGRIWLRVRKGHSAANRRLPDECMLVARGEPITAGRLLRAENFAANVWWGAGIAVCGLFVFAPITAVSIRGHLGGDVAAWVAGVAGSLVILFMSQMGYIRFQSYRLLFYLRRSGLDADDRPLAPGAPGRPRSTDFWMTLGGSAIVCGLLLFGTFQATAGH
jgi:hypothetical protein